MHDNNIRVWSVSVLLALLVHGAVLFSWSESDPVIKTTGESSVNSIKLSFKRTIKPDEVIQKKVKSEPVNKPPVKPVNRSDKKSAIKSFEEKPQPETAVRKTDEVVEQESDSHVIDSESENDLLLIKKNRLNYFNQLISHIERYKFYPGSARRRGIEGKVSICFDLNTDGSISSLTVESKHRILKQAAEEAIKSALPMPLPDKGVKLERKVDFNMLYAMK